MRLQQFFQLLHNRIHKLFAFGALLVDVLDEVFIGGGIEIFERKVLQFAIDLADTEPSRDGTKDVKRLARHALLPLLAQKI